MGEAKRKRQERAAWPDTDSYRGVIDLHVLPSVAAINGARIRELTGDDAIPDSTQIILRAFKAVVGPRTFHVGFCLGDGESFSAIGIAVIERLAMEAPGASLHIVPIVHEDIAWDIVMRHLRSFTGQVLLFAFPNSDVYDAGTAQVSYSKHIRQFDAEGKQLDRLTDAQRRRILEQKAAILDRPPPPKFYSAQEVAQEDSPWIFRITTPVGKTIRTAVWDGRRNYAHEIPADIVRWVGGDKIAIVQVDSPVGVNRRSSLDLTHHLAKDFDGVIHWARDTETFQSILKSFIRLDLDSVSPPGGYAGDKLRDALRRIDKWTIEIVKRCDTAKGFVALPRRWVVERTLAWLNRNRRLARDFEQTIASATSWLFIASIQLFTRRIARS